MSSFRQALSVGALITAAGVILFFAVPNGNMYLTAPGVVLAMVANGGPHGGGLGDHFMVWFWVITIGVNLLVYSLVAWLFITVFRILNPQR